MVRDGFAAMMLDSTLDSNALPVSAPDPEALGAAWEGAVVVAGLLVWVWGDAGCVSTVELCVADRVVWVPEPTEGFSTDGAGALGSAVDAKGPRMVSMMVVRIVVN